MAAYGALPKTNPHGQRLTVDQIQVVRDQPQPYELMGLITNAFEFVKQHPVETVVSQLILFFAYMMIYMVMYVLTVIGAMIAVLGAAALSEVNEVLGQIFSIVLITGVYGFSFLVQVILQTVIMGAYWIIWLRVVRGQPVGLENLADVRPFIKPIVLTGLLFTIGTLTGMLLLIIPGYIFALGCWFGYIVVLDKNLGPVDALKASWRITDGHKLNIFLYFIITGFMNFVGMLFCGVGMLATIPITIGGMAILYDKLAEPGNAYAPESQAADVFT